MAGALVAVGAVLMQLSGGPMRRWCVLGVVALAALAGCAVPYDDDGEMTPTGQLDAGAAQDAEATPVVVDTDLGGDDLVALAFLLRHRRCASRR